MKRSTLMALSLTAVCLVAAWGVVAQHRQLAGLKDQKGQILEQLSEPLEARPASTSISQEPGKSETADSRPAAASSELLQLRRKVVQLTDRKRELTGVRIENERLRSQLAGRGTNAAGERPLPPDYIRKSTAQWVGLGTPEHTLQSFLWAVQNRDMTNLLHVVTAESGAHLLQQLNDSPDKVFDDAAGVPGLRVVRQRALPDGSIELDVEFMPGTPAPQSVHLRPVGLEWKLDIY